MELYVIRHGQTIVNAMKLINSRNSIGLNKKGRNEAVISTKSLENIKIDLIFCSPLRRTKQTCKIINKNKVKVIYDKRILERNTNSMQFKKISKLDVYKWYDVDKYIVYKDVEGFKSVLERVEEFLKEINKNYYNKSVLLVTHGDVCKAIYAYLNNITDIETISLFEQKNCEVKKYELK